MVKKYSKLTGFLKSLKNVAVTYGPAMFLVLLNHYQEWMPDKHAVSLAPLIGVIAYYIKNYEENK